MKIEIESDKIIINDVYLVKNRKITYIGNNPPPVMGDIPNLITIGTSHIYLYGDSPFETVTTISPFETVTTISPFETVTTISPFEDIEEIKKGIPDFKLIVIAPEQGFVVWEKKYKKEE